MRRHHVRRRSPLKLFTMLAAASTIAATAAASHQSDDPASGLAAVVVDARDGGVIYQAGADRPQSPGAATRLMVLYLTAEAIEAGRLRLDEGLNGSPRRRTVAEALRELGGADSATAAAQLARRISGDEARFVTEMSRRAVALGMTHTRFLNVSGAPEHGQVSTAADVATLMWSLHRDYPSAAAWLGPDTRTERLLRVASPPACLIPRIRRIRCAEGRSDPQNAVAVVMGRAEGLRDLVLIAEAGRAVGHRLLRGETVLVAQTLAGAPPPAVGPGVVIVVDRGPADTL